jgi:endonuclease/exonuclease/phosphatase family metal-dependent hydrolase
MDSRASRTQSLLESRPMSGTKLARDLIRSTANLWPLSFWREHRQQWTEPSWHLETSPTLRTLRRMANDYREQRRLWPGPDLPGLAAAADLPTKELSSLRLFSLNVAHGRRLATHQAFLTRTTALRNVQEVAQVVRSLDVDLVALQEADRTSAWSGKFDHVAELELHAELSDSFHGHHNPFGTEAFPLASGTALLARRPLGDRHSQPFAANWRDTKGFVVASVRVPQWANLEIDAISVHLDFLSARIRRRQIAQMIEVVSARRRPRILLGDLNCCFKSEPETMALIRDRLGLEAHAPELDEPTFPVHRPRRRLDWILASPDLRFTLYRTLRVPLSDHLGIVADLCPVT